MWRIAESYGIGNVLVGLIGAAGTFFFGLKFAAAYILGITIVHIARWEVPGKGADGGVGHACPVCVMDPDSFEEILERRDGVTRRIIEGHPPTEDATPFEGVDEAETSEGSGEAAAGDPSDDSSAPTATGAKG
jgi:hypothetical protein